MNEPKSNVNKSIELERFENCFDLLDDDWDSLNQMLQEFMVPKNTVIDDHPFEETDFKTVPEVSVTCLNILSTLFSHGRNTALERNTHAMKCIYSTILICGEHSAQYLWSNNASISSSKKALNNLLQTLDYESMYSFLVNEDSRKKLHGVHLLLQLSKKLSNEDWKYFPAAIKCYSWLLYEIKMPHMKDFISITLPQSLKILSDYETENKILGLECLHHIVANISTSELLWNIQIEVLQEVLKPLFYYREAELIVPLILCTLEVINKSQFTSKELDPKVDLKWSFMDEVLTIFLPMMEYELNIQRRCAYAKSFCLILKNSNFSISKWSATLLRILDDYSKTSVTEVETCQALDTYLHICWPLVKNHWRLINLIAGRILFKSCNDEALRRAECVLNLLHKFLPDIEIVSSEQIKSKRKM